MDVDEEGEPFFYIFESHFRLLLRFLVGLSINWTSFKCSLNTVRLFLFKTETMAMFLFLFLLYYCIFAPDYWAALLLKKIPNEWLLKFGYTKIKPKETCDGEALTINNVGIYAIRGRRSKMEDTFSYCDETERFGLQMYGVFDGHGGDTASKLVRERLFKSILNTMENNSIIDECSQIATTPEPREETKLNESSSETCPAGSITSGFKPPDSVSWSRSHVNEIHRKGPIKPKDISRILSEKIIDLDKEIVKEMKKNNDVSGTTALVAVNMVKEKTLIVANVGDSRAVLCDHKGNAIPLSFDHKPNQLKESKRISDAGGFIQFNGVWRVAGILATSRALGDYPLKDCNLVIPDPDILSFDLKHVKPSFMILASDGLWDTFTNEEASEFVKINLAMLRKRSWKSSNSIAQELARSLVHRSHQKGSLDNITVIIVLFDA